MRTTVNRASENTRRKIVKAAFDEFYRNGFHGGSINCIVKKAGTTKGALFHHFNGKDDLGYAVVEEVIQPEMKKRWFDSLANSTDPIADLKRAFKEYRKEEIRSGLLLNGCPLNNLAQEMSPLDEGFRERIERVYDSWRDCLAKAFARGIKAGKVREDVSPRQVATFVVAAQTGMIGTAKNAQSDALLMQAGQALFDYLDGLKP